MTIKKTDTDALTSSVSAGDRKSLARAISLVENDEEGSAEFLKSLKMGVAPIIGFTGPPGAGKSTLINAFLNKIVSMNKSAAVIAVDPTSPFNFGSLLADRVRMSDHFNNKNVFIRSVATRGSLGGLSDKIIEITDVIRSANFDYIIIETVGVGQSEVEIAGLADTTVVVVVPESGDEIQVMKSGIMEIADIFVVNKSDRPSADALVNNLKKMLSGKEKHPVPVVSTVATEGKGIDELIGLINSHSQSEEFREKKIYLMTEKVFRIIRATRMQGIRRELIREKLENASKDESFNLYSFAARLDNELK